MIEHRYEKRDLEQISALWEEELKAALNQIPDNWMEAALSKLPQEVISK
jgi:putative proteasome-type protease